MMAQGFRLEILYPCISFENLWIWAFIGVWLGLFLIQKGRVSKTFPLQTLVSSARLKPGQSRPSSGTCWVAKYKEK